jgi:hypothetical protein
MRIETSVLTESIMKEASYFVHEKYDKYKDLFRIMAFLEGVEWLLNHQSETERSKLRAERMDDNDGVSTGGDTKAV